MTNHKHVEHEIAKQVRELAADELECVSGGKPASKEASGVMFLAFTRIGGGEVKTIAGWVGGWCGGGGHCSGARTRLRNVLPLLQIIAD